MNDRMCVRTRIARSQFKPEDQISSIFQAWCFMSIKMMAMKLFQPQPGIIMRTSPTKHQLLWRGTMNETIVSENDWVHLREQPSGEPYGTRRLKQYVCCVGNGQLHQLNGGECSYALNCMHDQQAVICSDVGITSNENRKYIIRRLTPLECCRLQGFPDGWGDIPDIQELTAEEAEAWENSRRTYLEINGKTYKPISKERLISWLNKLHTDSAEYKMWGNGIALPCATDVLSRISKAHNCDQRSSE